MPLYTRKGLLKKYVDAKELAEGLSLPETKLVDTFDKYNAVCAPSLRSQSLKVAKAGSDSYGKTKFNSVPYTSTSGDELTSTDRLTGLGPFHAGTVTPALHYCMGGISITPRGQVRTQSGEIIPGLWAAGEVREKE